MPSKILGIPGFIVDSLLGFVDCERSIQLHNSDNDDRSTTTIFLAYHCCRSYMQELDLHPYIQLYSLEQQPPELSTS